jgi:hypothetical protein
MGVAGEPGERTIRLTLLRDLERRIAEKEPEHVGLLAAVRALISEGEQHELNSSQSSA